ncbi:hypothetical protein ES703_72249 [subsurface metagenome]
MELTGLLRQISFLVELSASAWARGFGQGSGSPAVRQDQGGTALAGSQLSRWLEEGSDFDYRERFLGLPPAAVA